MKKKSLTKVDQHSVKVKQQKLCKVITNITNVHKKSLEPFKQELSHPEEEGPVGLGRRPTLLASNSPLVLSSTASTGSSHSLKTVT
jgi:hypothetical protein